jgi:hypothetical protein
VFMMKHLNANESYEEITQCDVIRARMGENLSKKVFKYCYLHISKRRRGMDEERESGERDER